MSSQTDQMVKWMIELETNAKDLAKNNYPAFQQFEKLVQDVGDEAELYIKSGVKQFDAYANAIDKLGVVLESTFKGSKKGLEQFVSSLDPKIVERFNKDIFTLVASVKTEGMEPLLNFIGEKSELVKEFNYIKSLSTKTGDDFGKGFRYSSIPYLKDVWKTVSEGPDSGQLSDALREVFSKIADEESIPKEFITKLSDAKAVKWFLKDFGKNVKGLKGAGFNAAWTELLERGAKKGFLPELSKDLERQGKISKGFFSKFLNR
jgi:hypothetical protein